MSDETDQTAGRIIDAFGGIRPMAARLNVPVSTVQGWKQRDTIPAGRMEAVRAAAQDAGIALDSANVVTSGAVTSNAVTSTAVASAPADPVEPDPVESDPARESTEEPEIPSDSPARTVSPAAEQAAPRGGGLAVVALVVALAVGGWVWWSTMGPGATGGDNARLSALEGRVARLAETRGDAGPAADPTAMAALTRDVAALRAQIADLSVPDMESVLAPLRAEIDELRQTLAAQETGDGGPMAADPAIQARLDALDAEIRNAIQIAATNMQAMSGGILEFDAKLKALVESQDAMAPRIAALEAGRTASQNAVSRASALALAAGQLRAALERGAPFEGPLDLAGSLGDDNPDLSAAFATLREMAETGVATAPSLEISFAELVPQLLAAGRRGESGDIVDRLADRINDIVSVRRTGAGVPGDDTEARIARAEIFLADRDVAAALTEFKDADTAPADILAPWLASARAHLDAHAALAVIEAQAIARLRAEDRS